MNIWTYKGTKVKIVYLHNTNFYKHYWLEVANNQVGYYRIITGYTLYFVLKTESRLIILKNKIPKR